MPGWLTWLIICGVIVAFIASLGGLAADFIGEQSELEHGQE